MWRGVSKGFGFAGGVLPQRFVGEGIELPRLNVALQLTIPHFPVKIQKPLPELRKFLRGQFPNLVLDSINFAHITSLALSPQRRLTSALSSEIKVSCPCDYGAHRPRD